jgi:hypothetical protein
MKNNAATATTTAAAALYLAWKSMSTNRMEGKIRIMHLRCKGKLKKEIVDLRDKVGDFRFRNDYLDCKVFKLEDTLERKR